jgi:hypothetical protein
MDQNPDFVRHVAERLGVSDADALAALGSWLASYEPLESVRPSRPRGRGFGGGQPGERLAREVSRHDLHGERTREVGQAESAQRP